MWLRMARNYLIAAAVALAVSVIYEFCSHGVYSAFMVGLAAWPLVLGVLPSWIAGRADAPDPTPSARTLLAAGVCTFTFGSLMTGVMEIYGSTSAYTHLYWEVGAVIMFLAVVACLAGIARASTN